MLDRLIHWIASNSAIAVAAGSSVIAAVSAIVAVRTYRRNSNTKTAEFLLELHRSFFVEATYKPIRNLLDDDSETSIAELEVHIANESSELTDFLIFSNSQPTFRLVKHWTERM